MKSWIVRIIILAAVLGAGYGGWRMFQQLPQRQQQVATTKVRQGDVVVRSYARGELRAVRSVTLTAPNLFGTVQVTKLAALGAFAKEKDLVIEFDDAEVVSRLEEKQLELEQIDEQLKKATAELNIRNNQDQVELLRARYSVRRAELEVKRNELVSAIDAKKNNLTLDESKRRLKQLESDIQSRQQQAQAELAVLRERKNKATLEMARERARLLQVKLLSPMSGLVAIKQNRGSAMMFGMQLPDIREGDQIQPGTPVADVLDLSELEVIAKVGELDRANLKEGQNVNMRLDAIPDKEFNGLIKSMSSTASANMFSSDPAKKFDVLFSIDMRQLLSTLGAKPDYIAKVLATAEANRKKPVASSLLASGGGMPMMMMAGGGGGAMFAGGGSGGMMVAGGGGGGFGGGGMPMPTMGGQQGAEGQQGGQRRSGGSTGGMFGGADLTPEQQTKLREAMTKALNGKSMQDLSQDERRELFTKLRTEMEKITGRPAPSRKPDAAKPEGGAPGETRAQTAQEGGEGRRGRRSESGGGGAPNVLALGGQGPFTQKDLENAKLPPPPEEDSQLDVLLRPGLLADVEIIVDKIPNAIHVPNQAVFEKEGKFVVYVKAGNRFEERVIKPLKRSESVMVIAEGLKPNEIVALADPNAKPGDSKKKGGEKTGAPSPGSGPGGGPAGGMGGMRGGR